jgi:hypothetical protein
MSPSEDFRRFAGECRDMAKFTRSPESKTAWDHMAARWVRLAEINDIHSKVAATLVRQRNRQSISRRALRDLARGSLDWPCRQAASIRRPLGLLFPKVVVRRLPRAGGSTDGGATPPGRPESFPGVVQAGPIRRPRLQC